MQWHRQRLPSYPTDRMDDPYGSLSSLLGITLSILGFVVAAAAGGAIIGLREAIGLFQTVFFATGSERLYLYVEGLPWWRVLLAAAVLGAPISTILIIFEMTGDYALTMAVMVAVVVASVITQNFYGASFFAKQLEQRGYDLKEGFESALLRALDVGHVMARDSAVVRPETDLPIVRAQLQASAQGRLFVVDAGGHLFGTITLADLSEAAFDPAVDALINAGDVARLHPPTLAAGDDLETALKLIRDTGEPHIAVVEDADTLVFLGCVHERDVMNAYNRALVESRREERGD